MDASTPKSRKAVEIGRLLWTGGVDPDSNPHLCPYRTDGMPLLECSSISGQNMYMNRACGGAHRGTITFEPCSSKERRCAQCIAEGKRGAKANAAVDPKSGLCVNHGGTPVVLPATAVVDTNPEPNETEPSHTVASLSQSVCDPYHAYINRALDLTDGLTERQFGILRHFAITMDPSTIARALGTTTASVMTGISTLIGDLELRTLPKVQKRTVLREVARRFIADNPIPAEREHMKRRKKRNGSRAAERVPHGQ